MMSRCLDVANERAAAYVPRVEYTSLWHRQSGRVVGLERVVKGGKTDVIHCFATLLITAAR